MTENILTQPILKGLLHYNPETGFFTWIKNRGRLAKKGDESGSIGKDGYVRIVIHGRSYLAHRLAFLFMTGDFPIEQVDHINHARDDNRMCNLRACTSSENNQNAMKRKDNKSGMTGVYWHKIARKWSAEITINKIKTRIGFFDDINHAIIARWMAEDETGFHPNHGT